MDQGLEDRGGERSSGEGREISRKSIVLAESVGNGMGEMLWRRGMRTILNDASRRDETKTPPKWDVRKI